MLTRSKLKLGEGEIVEANPEIRRVYPRRRMVEKNPIGIRISVHGQFYGHASHGGRDVSKIQEGSR